jgi:ribonucleoside-triphosphate reductase (thioredoxin)
MHTDTFTITLPGRRNRSISTQQREVVKRDGRVVPWDAGKITRAIALAFYDVRHSGAPNPHRAEPSHCYGLESEDFLKAVAITQRVSQMLELFYLDGRLPSIEDVQDTVEKAIAAEGEWEVAKSFILYRQRKSELRIHRYEENGLGDYIAVAKYARYRPDLGRRETFGEAAGRVADMHLKKVSRQKARRVLATHYARLRRSGEIDARVDTSLIEFLGKKTLAEATVEAFEAVKEKKVLPAMRSLQFGGEAILAANARMFNCSFSAVDRVTFFREYFYLLLAGCGCGFSVQKHHVARLPSMPKRAPEMDLPVRHHAVEDTIEGWGDALDELFRSFLDGYKVEFSYSRIRPRGSALRTSGGRAPGHLPLKKALGEVERILAGAAGRKLKPIEAYDICMHVARAVLAGGVRRSATICLFSADDLDMMSAKTGDWFQTNPQRSASNNSAVILRDAGGEQDFRRLFESQKEFGEPGFYFTNSRDFGCNPCCEIGLNPILQGVLSETDQARLRELGYEGELTGEVLLSGWQMCNLTTINAAEVQSEEDFYHACFWASLIGTLQAAYTDIPYLGPVSRFLNEREALLGVSICGVLDNPEVFLNSRILEQGAEICKATNATVAQALGIRRAARVTCVKPEGTASLLLNTGSGIHPHHAKRYFRRVQANRNEPVYQFFRKANPHMTEPSVYQPETDDVITFPVQAPETAILREEIGAVQFLEYVKFVQKHWVQAGRAHSEYSPGLDHNVSNTCTVKPEEWADVASFIWENREYFTGVSLLPYSGDKIYAQAPREEVSTDEDISKWNRLKYHPVDYTGLKERTDETKLKEVVACGGGACEL